MLLHLIFLIICSFAAEAAKPVADYGAQPTHFEPNAQQSFDYIARTGRYTLLVNSREAQFLTPRDHAISMHLDGARRVDAAATDKLAGVSHYYFGPDERGWRTNVPHYSRLRWAQVYEGIDIVYYTRGREIEFDFEIAPGADARLIRLRFEGASHLRINQEGALELSTPDGVLLKRPPIAYQAARGGKRRTIPVRYALHHNEVTFELGAFDKRRPLTIDPSVAYSTYLGGEGADRPTALAVDINTSAYLAGYTSSTFFPGAGMKPASGEVGFVTKLTPAGNGIVYSLYFNAVPWAIAVDKSGAVYLSGHTAGSLAVKNAFQPQLAGQTDAFVAKFDPSGALAFSTYLGGSGEENAQVNGGVRVDPNGAVYVAGWTKSTDFPVKNAFQPVNAGRQDAFVAKFDPSGTSLVFSTYLGGSGDESPRSFDIEASQHPVLAGRTGSLDYPVTQTETPFDITGGMVTRLDGSGQRLRYSTIMAGGVSYYQSIAALTDGSVALIGIGGSVCRSLGCVQRLSSNHQFSVAYAARSEWPSYLSTVAADPFGNMIVSGGLVQEFALSTGGTPMVNPVRYRSTGDDALLMLLRPDGQILFSTFWGGWVGSLGAAGTQYPIGAAGDSSGGLYLAGLTNAADIFISENAVQPANGGGQDAFLVKFAPGFQQILTTVRFDSPVPITVDGTIHPTRRVFQWFSGTTHQVAVPETYLTTYERHTQGKWSHGGPLDQTITVGNTDAVYFATYKTEVKVETQVLPVGAGSVILTPSSADGFYSKWSSVTFAAIPAAGYRFVRWTGSATIEQNNITRQIYLQSPSSPFRMVANFDTNTGGPASASLVPMTSPCRILDTRPESGFPTPFGAPAMDAGATREIPVPQGACGIPLGAAAYAVNITVIPLEPLGYLTAFPTGQPIPPTSTLNAAHGRITSNGTIAKAGTNGSISIYATNRTHVIVDITGYFTPSAVPPLSAFPMPNCSVLDTRQGTPLVPGQVRLVNPLSTCFVPPEVKAAMITVTAFPRGPLAWLSLSGVAPPTTSILNSPQGEVRSTTAIVAVNGSTFPIQASDSTDVTIDVMAYFTTATPTFSFNAVTPCRALDTRNGDGPMLTANQTRFASLAGRCAIPSNTTQVVFNATFLPLAPLTSLQLQGLARSVSVQAKPGTATAQTLLAQSLGYEVVLQMKPDADTHVVLDVIGYITHPY
ncbi:MAG: SBBP repeat-containing protein [Acidobacteria bacterium]|nr:SBBP repeat-containing protein [Acidobacteriota bacterium]